MFPIAPNHPILVNDKDKLNYYINIISEELNLHEIIVIHNNNILNKSYDAKIRFYESLHQYINKNNLIKNMKIFKELHRNYV